VGLTIDTVDQGNDDVEALGLHETADFPSSAFNVSNSRDNEIPCAAASLNI